MCPVDPCFGGLILVESGSGGPTDGIAPIGWCRERGTIAFPDRVGSRGFTYYWDVGRLNGIQSNRKTPLR